MRGHALLLDDRFPIEICSRRLKDAVLAEFGGHCPTVREVISVPATHWTVVPGLGVATLRELRHIIRSMPEKIRSRSLIGSTDAELLSHHAELHHKLHHLHCELRAHQAELRAVTAELRARGVTLEGKKINRGRRLSAHKSSPPKGVM